MPPRQVLYPSINTHRDPALGQRYGMRAPIDLEFAGPDPNEPRTVSLCVTRRQMPETVQERHWKLAWATVPLSTDSTCLGFRVIEVKQMPGYEFYTNWGPYTTIFDRESYERGINIHLRDMTLLEREKLEDIAWDTPPPTEHSGMSDQHWVASVLQKAVYAGLLSEGQKDYALYYAQQP
ncbi:hypothetical protein SISSUDRAFT_387858 [Sistotremastrum suecicum HHB10207 ss-3]|uniref:Uncharacterized protein n=1 Tax=Sistotremastrum suecicum HHB10207 ss-3 TaxID=1314776 RepID=A0A166FWE0_9AGAM|nr:hypothetical protein SISSUDRAFT_387858 [Sistotremastrum suecicum HHB10207 ss-3]